MKRTPKDDTKLTDLRARFSDLSDEELRWALFVIRLGADGCVCMVTKPNGYDCGACQARSLLKKLEPGS